ncbi:MAG: mechanosensitive ion channel domain-containing protein [Candidatus Aminicenantaceae bacterium]
MKEFFSELFEAGQFLDSAKALMSKVWAYLPKIVFAILIILFGWFIARIVSKIIGKLGKKLGLNKMFEKLGITKGLKKVGVKRPVYSIFSAAIFWIIFLVFLFLATDILGLDAVSIAIGKIISYLPNILAAIIIFIIGLLIANFVKRIITSSTEAIGIEYGDKLGLVVAYIIIIVVSISALAQLKISTHIFVSVINITLGIFVFSFGALFIFGARNIVENILSGYYIRKDFKEGDHITCGDIKGKIVEIGSINTALEDGEKRWMLPNSKFMKEIVLKKNKS